MTIYFVSRHPGAVAWAAQEGIEVDEQVTHLNTDVVRSGDVVIGSLPVHLVAEVCEHGGRYLHLSMEMPQEMRGKEITADDMRACNARLEGFRVLREG